MRDSIKIIIACIVCLGIDNSPIHKAFDNTGLPMVDVTSMDDAVNEAYKMGKPGDTVLLSPACASFDLFDNYEDRGNKFKIAVRNL